MPPARDLTPLEGVRAFIYAVPEATPGQDRWSASTTATRRSTTSTGSTSRPASATLLIKNEQNVAGWIRPTSTGNVRGWRCARRRTAVPRC